MLRYMLLGALALGPGTAALAAGPVEVRASVLAESRVAAADGTTRVTLAPPSRAVPGTAVLYKLQYRNTGSAPATDVVLANPVPGDLSFAGVVTSQGTAEVSVDGKSFAALRSLTVRGADGVQRSATNADVRAVRWRLPAIQPGAGGEVSFRATIK